jgi:protein TonB
VSENRFLQSFSALLASAILVCGTHLLLIASQEYGRPELAPARVVTAAPSVAEPPARESIDVEITGTTEARSHPDANHFAADQASLSPTPDEATTASEADTEVVSSSVYNPEVDASSSETIPAEATEEVTPSTETADTPSPKVAEAAPAQPNEETNPPQETAQVVLSPNVAEAAPAHQTADVAPEEKEVAPAQEIEKESVTSSAEPAAPSAPKPIESTTAPTAEDITPTAPQVAEADDVTPVAPAPVANEPEAQSASKLAVAEVTPPNTESAKVKPVVANVPLLTRKLKVVAAKPIAPAVVPQVAEVKKATVKSKPRWTPMALAPADKDTVAKPRLEPKRSESLSGYNAKVWSALARHKPRVGKAGSAIVTFAIGPAGGLRSARISGSSGDARLDQMALQTVRGAAPFPPPPNSASASYTIRIYFR